MCDNEGCINLGLRTKDLEEDVSMLKQAMKQVYDIDRYYPEYDDKTYAERVDNLNKEVGNWKFDCWKNNERAIHACNENDMRLQRLSEIMENQSTELRVIGSRLRQMARERKEDV
jgi:hypothetical protein